MVSAHPGLVPRLSGRHTNERITCVTVYKDHYTDYSYSHLQTDESGDSTEASKKAFERHANDYGNKIMSYHADNGRFAELQFREAIKIPINRFRFVLWEHIIKTESLKGILEC